jgi:DNA-binding SARP family transcriptional activator
VRLDLLGPSRLVDETGSDIDVPSARQRVLLAALVLSPNQIVSVDELVELVWDGRPPTGAVRTLRVYVARLRAVLGDANANRVVTREPGYLWRTDPGEVDVREFETLCGRGAESLRAGDWAEAADRLAQALRLWRGVPLVDVPSQMLRDRTLPRLERLRADALEGRIEADLHLGRHREVVAELRQLIEAEPVRESLYALLMLALYRSGRPSDALTVFHDARRVLADELGVDPSPELRDLHERILVTDPGLAVAPPPNDAGSRPFLSMRGDLPDFVGRQDELRRLTALIEDSPTGTVAALAVNGMAGVGKTAFCVHAAHHLAARFPDGQIFLELHGHTPGQPPVPVSDALGSLLAAAGVDPTRIPPSVDDRARLWRTRSAELALLLLLDDAASAEQVRPLLPGTSRSLVLISSRHDLAGLDGVRPLTLDVLPTADGMLMVRRISGRDLDEHALADIVTTRCGRLPLAIALVAARLRGHPAWTGEYLLDLLADSDDDLEPLRAGDRSVRAAFQMSLDHLPSSRQHLFGLLGVVPGSAFDAHAIAALADTTVASARADLDACHEDHLLQETAPGRYRLHDLLRAYARSLAADLPPEVRRDALRRLRDYYLYAARTAATLLPPRRTASRAPRPATPVPTPSLLTRAAAQRWFETELSTLVACVEQAAVDEPPWVADITDALHAFLCLAGDRQLAQHIYRTALDATVATGNRADEAIAHHDLCMMFWLAGDDVSAADHAQRSHELCRASGDLLGQANALTSLGLCRRFQGDAAAGAQILSHSLALHDRMDDRLGRGHTLTLLGSVQRVLGRYTESAHNLRRGLALFDQLDEDFGRATVRCEMGAVQHGVGDYRAAIDSFTTAFDLFTRLGSRVGRGFSLSELGQLYSVIGDHATAIAMLHEAYQLWTDSGDMLGRANTLAYLGIAHSALGKYGEAKDALRQANDQYTAMNSRHGQANVCASLGAVQRREGDFAAATETMTRSHALYVEVGARFGEAESLIGLGELALDHPPAGDPAEYFDRALTIVREVGAVPLEGAALRGKALVLIQRGDPTAARALLVDARVIYERIHAPEVAAINRVLADL